MVVPVSYPKISVVTPSLNQGAYIERTIVSVIGQNYPNLEYMIIDGASSDCTLEVITRYEEELSYWESVADKGQSHAINKGLSRATGDIFLWINSDDTLAPGALWKIASYHKRYPSADLIYGHTCLIDKDDKPIRRLLAVQTNSAELVHFNRNIFSQPGTSWKLRLVKKIGQLDESLHYTMDCDYFIRAAQAGTIKFIPEHFGNLRVHDETKSTNTQDGFKREHALLTARYGTVERKAWKKGIFDFKRLMRIAMQPKSIAWRLWG